jgi:NADH dehydrogenase
MKMPTMVRARSLAGDAFFSVLARSIRLLPRLPIIGSVAVHPLAADELARCLAAVVDKGIAVNRGLFDLGGPEVLRYEQMVDAVMEVVGVRQWKLHVPVPLVWPAAWAMERVMPKPLLTPEQLRLLRWIAW